MNHIKTLTLSVLASLFVYIASPFLALAAGESITITTPKSWQIVQRNLSTNQANISVSGSYTGVTSGVEASWNGGTWAGLTVTPNGNGGTYSGVIYNQPAGSGNLSVRFSDNTSVSTTVSNVGVGDVYAVIGDSNASGYGYENQAYTGPAGMASMFTNGNYWTNMQDPFDTVGEDGVNQNCRWEYVVVCMYHATRDTGTQKGSIWPSVASKLTTANPNVPVGFLAAPKSGGMLHCATTSTYNTNCWQRAAAGWKYDKYYSLYGDFYQKMQTMGGGSSARAVLWFEGVNDRVTADKEVYKSKVRELANAIQEDFQLPLMVSSPGDCWNDSCQSTPAYIHGVDLVRQAAKELWAENGNILRGPVLYDIDKITGGDNLHYRTNEAIATASERTALAMLQTFYGANTAGPVLQSATSDGNSVVLDFGTNSSLFNPGVNLDDVAVKADGTVVSGTVATVTDNDTVTVQLPQFNSGSLTASIAENRSSLSANIVADTRYGTGAKGVPADPVLDFAVTSTIPDTTPPTGSIQINNGAAQTASQNVTLQLGGSDDRGTEGLEMRIANDSNFTGASWQPFASSASWVLSDGFGQKTVYYQVKDASGNQSIIYSDQIEYVEIILQDGTVKSVTGSATFAGSSSTANILFNVSRVTDMWGTRYQGTVGYKGVTYTQNNNVTSCGPGCAQGSAYKLFGSTIYWKVQHGVPQIITVSGNTGPVTTGAINIQYL